MDGRQGMKSERVVVPETPGSAHGTPPQPQYPLSLSTTTISSFSLYHTPLARKPHSSWKAQCRSRPAQRSLRLLNLYQSINPQASHPPKTRTTRNPSYQPDLGVQLQSQQQRHPSDGAVSITIRTNTSKTTSTTQTIPIERVKKKWMYDGLLRMEYQWMIKRILSRDHGQRETKSECSRSGSGIPSLPADNRRAVRIGKTIRHTRKYELLWLIQMIRPCQSTLCEHDAIIGMVLAVLITHPLGSRMWFLGIFFCIFIAGMNQFFSLRCAFLHLHLILLY